MALLLAKWFPFLDSNGDPASGGTVTFYDTNTTTLKTVYSDAGLTTPLANPQTLNAAGHLESNVYCADSERYTIAAVSSGGAALPGFPLNDIWGAIEDAPGSTYTPAGGTARTIQSKLNEVVSVKDFGAVGDGVTDDAAAIQTAIDYIDGRGNQGFLYFPVTGLDYIVGSTLTVSSASIKFVGENSRLAFTNTSGAAIRFKTNNCGLQSMVVFASGDRASASFAVTTPGVWIESDDDVSNGSVANFSMYDSQVSGHPGDGVLGVGTLIGFIAQDCSVINNKGHNFCFDRGERTSRTNKSTPGIIELQDIKATGAGGHAIAVGHPDDTTSIVYRFSALNVDSGGAQTYDAALRYTAHNWYVKGENHWIANCGMGGENTTAGYGADISSIYVVGRNIYLMNNRYIQCSPYAVTVGYDSGSISTDGVVIDGMRVISDEAPLDPAIEVEAGAINVWARAPYDTNITSLFTEGSVAYTAVLPDKTIMHRRELDAPSVYSEKTITINDDSVASLSFSGSAARGIVLIAGSVSGAGHAVVAFRVTDNVFTNGLALSADAAVTTGALTGTTGVDTNLTISAHTDGNLYIENRTGSSRTYSVTFMSMGNGFYTAVSDDS